MNSINLALVTWNVGGGPSGITPGTEKLLQCAQTADVIVVGLQEVGMARRGWKRHLARSLGHGWAYLGGESYAGMRLRVFAQVRDGEETPVLSSGMKVGAGFADRWPNKGAIAVEIRFSPSCRVLFVVAHLAANEHQLGDRQDDWRAIVRRLDKEKAFLSRGTDTIISVPLFHRYEHVFVLGDLNYRLVAPGNDRDSRVAWVQNCIDARDWPSLIQTDQLTMERLNGNVFANFQEAEISFAPTFKIDPKTGRYSSARIPSYCDRILWHSLPARIALVENVRYEPLSDFLQSDHVPVVAEFRLHIPIVSTPTAAFTAPKPSLRIVLEFMLVRYVKGKPSLFGNTEDGTGPLSMRPIKLFTDFAFTRSVNDDSSSSASIANQQLTTLTQDRPGGVPEIAEDDVDGIAKSRLTRLRNRNGSLYRVRDESDDEDEDIDDDDGDFSSTSSESSDDDDDVKISCHNGNVSGERPALPIHLPNETQLMYSSFDGPEELPLTPLPISDFAIPAPTPTPPSRSHHRRISTTGTIEYSEELLTNNFARFVTASSSTDASTAGLTPLLTPSGAIPFKLTASSGGGNCDVHDISAPSINNSNSNIALGPTLSTAEMSSTHSQSVPRKRDSLSRQVNEARIPSRTKRRSRLNGMRMEVHGRGLFLKQDSVYSISIPKRRNGKRERIGESLPVIPFAPISNLRDLEYRHVLIEFARKNSRVGISGALPLREILAHVDKPYAFELALTKYGLPVGTLEACIQLTVRETGCWVDSRSRVVRDAHGQSTKAYTGELPVRKKTRAKTKSEHSKWR